MCDCNMSFNLTTGLTNYTINLNLALKKNYNLANDVFPFPRQKHKMNTYTNMLQSSKQTKYFEWEMGRE